MPLICFLPQRSMRWESAFCLKVLLVSSSDLKVNLLSGRCFFSLSHSLLLSFSESFPKRVFLWTLSEALHPLFKISFWDPFHGRWQKSYLVYNNSQTGNLMCFYRLKRKGKKAGGCRAPALLGASLQRTSAGWAGYCGWIQNLGFISALLLRKKFLRDTGCNYSEVLFPKYQCLLRKENL